MIIFLATQCAQQYAITNQTGPDNLRYPQEKHLKNVTQLTFGGNNAEAYWSFDSKQLTFQSDYSPWTNGCDQIFRMTPGKSDLKNNKPIRISTGTGRTTCSYFMPGNKQILYASTHAAGRHVHQPLKETLMASMYGRSMRVLTYISQILMVK